MWPFKKKTEVKKIEQTKFYDVGKATAVFTLEDGTIKELTLAGYCFEAFSGDVRVTNAEHVLRQYLGSKNMFIEMNDKVSIPKSKVKSFIIKTESYLQPAD